MKQKKNGFTLVLVAFMMIVASIALIAVVQKEQFDRANSQVSNTTQKMQKIQDAIVTFVIKNRRLPCPADPDIIMTDTNFGVESRDASSPKNCTNAIHNADTNTINIGMVPVRTLGLSDFDGVDGYGNRFEYAVERDMTNSNLAPDSVVTNNFKDGTANLTVRPTSGGTALATGVAYVVISRGLNSNRAYKVFAGNPGVGSPTTTPTDVDERENSDCNTSGTCGNTQLDSNFVSKISTSTFDDAIVYRTKTNLITDCNQGYTVGTGRCETPQW